MAEQRAIWWYMHLTLGCIHFIQGLLILLIFGLDGTLHDTMQKIYFDKPRILSGNEDGIAMRQVHLFDTSPITLHGIVSVATGVSHFASCWVYQEFGLSPTRPNVIRWSEYAFTATLMSLSGYIALGGGDALIL
jgi:hypothetical protein